MSSDTLKRGICRVFDLRDGPVPYRDAWRWQHALMDELRKDVSATDALILLEHHPVYTLGTASKLENVLFDADELRCDDTSIDDSSKLGAHTTNQPSLFRTERGGEVTYHGPGQLVAYPILNLTRHKKDLHWYLRMLEETVIIMLRDQYGLEASRKEGLTGVWLGDRKVCAMGLKVSKWISMHGLALNVDTDLQPFDRIIPCGINDYGVTSIHDVVGDGRRVRMDDARAALLQAFVQVFGPYAGVKSLRAADLPGAALATP